MAVRDCLISPFLEEQLGIGEPDAESPAVFSRCSKGLATTGGNISREQAQLVAISSGIYGEDIQGSRFVISFER